MNSRNAKPDDRPIVLITGIAGSVGSALASALARDYRVVGMDVAEPEVAVDWIEIDLTSGKSVEGAVREFRERHGERIASVVHLAAYFDFSGEYKPLYDKVNVDGTRRLLRALQSLEVAQFVYSGTMLVHQATVPGERIDEDSPIRPRWAYPESKARAERVIAEEHGGIPYVLLHLAGLYDGRTAVPTLAQQIARIYERDFTGYVHAGDEDAGQSMIHRDDMIDAFRRAIDRRDRLPSGTTVLVGEPEAMSYRQLQDALGELIHGEEWTTINLPRPLAKAGAWLQGAAEPVVPDAIDHGEKPFIRPFMIEISSDHYALDISRARELLGWEPEHRIQDMLPRIVASLERDPVGWYRDNGITPPPWLEEAADKVDRPEALRQHAEDTFRDAHRRHLYGPFAVAMLGLWLVASPVTLGDIPAALRWSDSLSGIALVLLGMMTLSWRLASLRWLAAAVGLWVLFSPLVFWTGNAAAYLNDSLVGTLAIGFAVALPPSPGVSPVAACSGPTVPPGWEYSPSDWSQRLPIIALALVGLFVSRAMAAYQLGHVDGVWEPFFDVAGPKNGTETIITSSVSEAWPVPDAGLGALVYLLEILTGLIGSTRRWRTMPWLVVLFGFLIVPLGVVSITFIVIQPIVIGTWCTLCLIGAAAMVLQIPYSLDELVATGQFLHRRRKAGRNLLYVFFAGDTDDDSRVPHDGREFDRAPMDVLRDVGGGNVNAPWNLLLCIAIGVWLMFTRLTVGAEGPMANADHLIGSLVITVAVCALAEIARPVRLINIGFGVALLVTPFMLGATTVQTGSSLVCGVALIALSLRRGPIRMRYGNWNRLLI
ncbi:vitamin K epoxide reductase family protein [Marilutibacter chinensis]|uniref:NAD-dependent epimerase/dehydratase family protein n=1 Tax=Marilutibacter chinensis TaxID=2912247 RepID=A0ABS9HR09_9GAMM|nr:vitamin K epoxide reductase family protein [Lysobacter chinensis]MCF7220728.1 NAD-dependent epimerase/dehydratase family protein [Lysobacter chinensis]